MMFVVFALQSQNFDIQVNYKIVGLNSHFVQTEAIMKYIHFNPYPANVEKMVNS